jgi:adenine-specific DNA-methyltransferase
MAKEQHITQNITASNKDLEVLKKNFSHCFDKNGDFDFDKFKNELSEKEVNFSKESYGMDWLGKSYARLLASDTATTLLKEDEVFNAKEENKNSENLLIKGDNLEVLKHLSNAYYEKIKMIYIDPPYNTGSDGFVYQDDRKFTVKEFKHLAGVDEDAAKKILTFVDSKSNSHSAWLTFMYPRLYIAKQLLTDDGVIFISIDDNEVSQLRIIMDEIFGEENFVANAIWKHTEQSKNDEKFFSRQFNYHLAYKKTDAINKFRFPRTELDNRNYSNPDNDANGDWRSGDVRSPNYRKTLCYNIITPNGNKIEAPSNGWRWSEQTIKEKIKSGEVIFNKDETKIIRKIYLSNQDGRTPENLWQGDIYGTTRIANSEIKELFNDKVLFDTPKPTQLIIRTMQLISDSNDFTVLDFFAGSGTTGDAVMQLNAEDDGNRKFILAQLPEKIDKNSNKIAYDFVKDELNIEIPTIFDITKERLIRASKKIYEENTDKPAKSTKVKCEGCGEDGEHCQSCKGEHTIKIEATKKKDLSNQDLGFKIFETTPIWEDYNLESDTFDEKLQLFDELQLTKEDVKALLITWKTNDGIALTCNLEEIDLGNYTGYYFEDKMYLMDKGFTTDNLKTLLELIDTNKKINPASIIAFGYHFESKNLREISENIKSYANKKNIDIDFITRY